MTSKKATPRLMRYARYYYNYFFELLGIDPPTMKEMFIVSFFGFIIFFEFMFYILFIY